MTCTRVSEAVGIDSRIHKSAARSIANSRRVLGHWVSTHKGGRRSRCQPVESVEEQE
jgi:hypothetical protein